jgi:hypothetical protein
MRSRLCAVYTDRTNGKEGYVISLRRSGRYAFEWFERGFDEMFGPSWNPFHQLGALGWFFYWIVVVSGLSASTATPQTLWWW